MQLNLFDDKPHGPQGFRFRVVRNVGPLIRDQPPGPKTWLMSFLDADQVLEEHGGTAKAWTDEDRKAARRRKRPAAAVSTRRRGKTRSAAGSAQDGSRRRAKRVDDS